MTPNAPGTPRRTIRVADDLWAKALARKREARRIVVTLAATDSKDDAIRKFLERYAR